MNEQFDESDIPSCVWCGKTTDGRDYCSDGCRVMAEAPAPSQPTCIHGEEDCGYCKEAVRRQAAQPICPVCYQPLESLPENHTICPNCKTQFGYDDVGHSYEELRNMWQAAQTVASPTPEDVREWHRAHARDLGLQHWTVREFEGAAAFAREAIAVQSEAREKAEGELRRYKRATEEG